MSEGRFHLGRYLVIITGDQPTNKQEQKDTTSHQWGEQMTHRYPSREGAHNPMIQGRTVQCYFTHSTLPRIVMEGRRSCATGSKPRSTNINTHTSTHYRLVMNLTMILFAQFHNFYHCWEWRRQSVGCYRAVFVRRIPYALEIGRPVYRQRKQISPRVPYMYTDFLVPYASPTGPCS